MQLMTNSSGYRCMILLIESSQLVMVCLGTSNTAVIEMAAASGLQSGVALTAENGA